MKYRKRPVVVEAILYTGTDASRVRLAEFAGHWIDIGGVEVHVTTPSGSVVLVPGDWLIRGGKSDYYPCKAEVFAAVYEPAE